MSWFAQASRSFNAPGSPLPTRLKAVEAVVQHLSPAASVAELPVQVHRHYLQTALDWLLTLLAKTSTAGGSLEVAAGTAASSQAHCWELLGQILASDEALNLQINTAHVTTAVIAACNSAVVNAGGAMPLLDAVLEVLTRLNSGLAKSFRPSLEQLAPLTEAALAALQAAQGQPVQHGAAKLAALLMGQLAAAARLHPNPRKVFTSLLPRLLLPLARWAFPPGPCAIGADPEVAAVARVAEAALHAIVFDAQHIPGMAQHVMASSGIQTSSTTAPAVKKPRLELEVQGTPIPVEAAAAGEQPDMPVVAGYQKLLFEVIGSHLARDELQPEQRRGLLKSLPWALSSFCAAQKQQRKAAATEAAASAAVGSKRARGPAGLEPGDPSAVPLEQSAAAGFALFLQLLRPLQQRLAALLQPLEEGLSKTGAQAGGSRRHGKGIQAAAARQQRTDALEQAADLLSTVAGLVGALRDLGGYHSTADASGMQRAALQALADSLVAQPLMQLCCTSPATAAAAAGALQSLWDLEQRVVQPHLAACWSLTWATALGPGDAVVDAAALAACMLGAYAEVRQLDVLLDTLVAALLGLQQQPRQLRAAEQVLGQPGFVAALRTAVRGLPPGQRALTVQLVQRHVFTVAQCPAASTAALHLLGGCLQHLDVDLTTAAPVAAAVQNLLQACIAPVLVPLLQLATPGPYSDADTACLLAGLLRLYCTSLQVHAVCNAQHPEVQPLAGQDPTAAGIGGFFDALLGGLAEAALPQVAHLMRAAASHGAAPLHGAVVHAAVLRLQLLHQRTLLHSSACTAENGDDPTAHAELCELAEQLTALTAGGELQIEELVLCCCLLPLLGVHLPQARLAALLRSLMLAALPLDSVHGSGPRMQQEELGSLHAAAHLGSQQQARVMLRQHLLSLALFELPAGPAAWVAAACGLAKQMLLDSPQASWASWVSGQRSVAASQQHPHVHPDVLEALLAAQQLQLLSYPGCTAAEQPAAPGTQTAAEPSQRLRQLQALLRLLCDAEPDLLAPAELQVLAVLGLQLAGSSLHALQSCGPRPAIAVAADTECWAGCLCLSLQLAGGALEVLARCRYVLPDGWASLLLQAGLWLSPATQYAADACRAGPDAAGAALVEGCRRLMAGVVAWLAAGRLGDEALKQLVNALVVQLKEASTGTPSSATTRLLACLSHAALQQLCSQPRGVTSSAAMLPASMDGIKTLVEAVLLCTEQLLESARSSTVEWQQSQLAIADLLGALSHPLQLQQQAGSLLPRVGALLEAALAVALALDSGMLEGQQLIGGVVSLVGALTCTAPAALAAGASGSLVDILSVHGALAHALVPAQLPAALQHAASAADPGGVLLGLVACMDGSHGLCQQLMLGCKNFVAACNTSQLQQVHSSLHQQLAACRDPAAALALLQLCLAVLESVPLPRYTQRLIPLTLHYTRLLQETVLALATVNITQGGNEEHICCAALCGALRCLESIIGREGSFALPAAAVSQTVHCVLLALGSDASLHCQGRLPRKHSRWTLGSSAALFLASCRLLVSTLRHRNTALRRCSALLSCCLRCLMQQLLVWSSSTASAEGESQSIERRVLHACASEVARVCESLADCRPALPKCCMSVVADYVALVAAPVSPGYLAALEKLSIQESTGQLPSSAANVLRRGMYGLFGCLRPAEVQHLHAVMGQGVGGMRRNALAQLKKDFEQIHQYTGKV